MEHGVNITPVGFIIVGGNEGMNCPKFIPVDHCNALDKLLDYVPNILEKITPCNSKKDSKECNCNNGECHFGDGDLET